MAKNKVIDDSAVLEKALSVIKIKGPESFTLSDIAKVIGLAPATLLQRFGSKQELLIRAAKHAEVKLSEDLNVLKEKKLSWREELIILLCEMSDSCDSRQDLANHLGMLRLDMVDAELNLIAKKLADRFRQRIKELLDLGKAKRQLPLTVDTEHVTWELDALRHGLIIQWALSGDVTLHDWLRTNVISYLNRSR